MNRPGTVLALVALLACIAFAQTSSSNSSDPTGLREPVRFGIGPPPRFPVSAVVGDGGRTHVTQPMRAIKVYRDSAGRTRTERPAFAGAALRNHPNDPHIIEIVDPVAGVKYILDTENKVAHRQELPTRRPATNSVAVGTAGAGQMIATPARAPEAPDIERPQTTSEKLGTQTIEGVVAEGSRSTTTWAAGAQGNDRPITATYETWWSPELQVSVLTKSSDPRSGDYTMRLINIGRSEPDPSLFLLPAGYTVVDEKGDFTIRLGAQQR